jgi:hypothetical protein
LCKNNVEFNKVFQCENKSVLYKFSQSLNNYYLKNMITWIKNSILSMTIICILITSITSENTKVDIGSVSSTCGSAYDTTNPKDASSCHYSWQDKCCYVKSTDGKYARCIQVTTQETSSAGLTNFILNNYSNVDTTSIDCGSEPQIVSSAAASTTLTQSNCPISAVKGSPATFKDCGADSSSKCCFVTSTDVSRSTYCITPSNITSADNQRTAITNTYKGVLSVFCGSSLLSISDQAANVAISSSTCQKTTATSITSIDTCDTLNASNKCCYIKDTFNTGYCVSAPSGNNQIEQGIHHEEI